jgi:hypothetical protein
MIKAPLVILPFFLFNHILFKNYDFYLPMQALSLLSIIICLQDYKKLEINLIVLFLWILALLIFTIAYKKNSILNLLIVESTVLLSSYLLKKMKNKKNIAIADYVLFLISINLTIEQIPWFFILIGLSSLIVFLLHKKNDLIPLAPQILLSFWLNFSWQYLV